MDRWWSLYPNHFTKLAILVAPIHEATVPCNSSTRSCVSQVWLDSIIEPPSPGWYHTQSKRKRKERMGGWEKEHKICFRLMLGDHKCSSHNGSHLNWHCCAMMSRSIQLILTVQIQGTQSNQFLWYLLSLHSRLPIKLIPKVSICAWRRPSI